MRREVDHAGQFSGKRLHGIVGIQVRRPLVFQQKTLVSAKVNATWGLYPLPRTNPVALIVMDRFTRWKCYCNVPGYTGGGTEWKYLSHA